MYKLVSVTAKEFEPFHLLTPPADPKTLEILDNVFASSPDIVVNGNSYRIVLESRYFYVLNKDTNESVDENDRLFNQVVDALLAPLKQGFWIEGEGAHMSKMFVSSNGVSLANMGTIPFIAVSATQLRQIFSELAYRKTLVEEKDAAVKLKEFFPNQSALTMCYWGGGLDIFRPFQFLPGLDTLVIVDPHIQEDRTPCFFEAVKKEILRYANPRSRVFSWKDVFSNPKDSYYQQAVALIADFPEGKAKNIAKLYINAFVNAGFTVISVKRLHIPDAYKGKFEKMPVFSSFSVIDAHLRFTVSNKKVDGGKEKTVFLFSRAQSEEDFMYAEYDEKGNLSSLMPSPVKENVDVGFLRKQGWDVSTLAVQKVLRPERHAVVCLTPDFQGFSPRLDASGFDEAVRNRELFALTGRYDSDEVSWGTPFVFLHDKGSLLPDLFCLYFISQFNGLIDSYMSFMESIKKSPRDVMEYLPKITLTDEQQLKLAGAVTRKCGELLLRVNGVFETIREYEAKTGYEEAAKEAREWLKEAWIGSIKGLFEALIEAKLLPAEMAKRV